MAVGIVLKSFVVLKEMLGRWQSAPSEPLPRLRAPCQHPAFISSSPGCCRCPLRCCYLTLLGVSRMLKPGCASSPSLSSFSLFLINLLSCVWRAVGMSYGYNSNFFQRDVSVELLPRPESCRVSSSLQVSLSGHSFGEPSFQEGGQNGLSEKIPASFYLKQGHKKQLGIRYSWTDEIHSLFSPK